MLGDFLFQNLCYNIVSSYLCLTSHHRHHLVYLIFNSS